MVRLNILFVLFRLTSAGGNLLSESYPGFRHVGLRAPDISVMNLFASVARIAECYRQLELSPLSSFGKKDLSLLRKKDV